MAAARNASVIAWPRLWRPPAPAEGPEPIALAKECAVIACASSLTLAAAVEGLNGRRSPVSPRDQRRSVSVTTMLMRQPSHFLAEGGMVPNRVGQQNAVGDA